MALVFHPVTKARWEDFEALFEAKGGPSYCWCMAWRATSGQIKAFGNASRKPLIKGFVDRHQTIGLLGYLDATPIAWVSVAPRDTYRDLGGRPAEPDEEVWSLACMYIARQHRKNGYGRDLIDAASTYAKKRGATVLEAYPVDPDSPSYRFMGFVPAFEKLGFRPVGKAGSRRHVMRLALRPD